VLHKTAEPARKESENHILFTRADPWHYCNCCMSEVWIYSTL